MLNPSVNEAGKAGALEAARTEERVRLMRDGAINNAGFIVTGLMGLILVPILLKDLGVESYGLWVAALSVVGVVGMLDLGLDYAVTREVAASLRSGSGNHTAGFVQAAGNAVLLTAILGAFVVGALGLPLSGVLHLSAAGRKVAPTVFALGGITFFASRILAFATAVLNGLRRFDTTNGLAIVATLLRACGIIALIKAGAGLLGVSLWQAVAAMASALAGLVMLQRLEPEFRLRMGRPDWNFLRPHLPFGLSRQMTAAVSRFIWDPTALLIGMVLGSEWIASYNIAQKFPLAASALIWSASEPLIPAASQHQQGREEHTRVVLEAGTRWIVVLALPLCIVLGILGRNLLQAWVGETRPDTVLVLRLITVAVFVEAIGVASTEVLWGMGAIRTVLWITGGAIATSLCLSLVLLPRIGIAGAAWALLVSAMLTTMLVLRRACRACGAGVGKLIGDTFEGLILPASGCLLIAWSAAQLAGRGRWPEVIATAMASGATYLVVLYALGAREDEKRFAREALRLPVAITASLYTKVRKSFSPTERGRTR